MVHKRVIALFSIFILLFCLMALRLTQLSVADTGLTQAAATHGSYSVTVATVRGTIYDTNMIPLVNREKIYYAIVSPSDENIPQILAGLSPYVSDVDTLKKKLEGGLPFSIEVSSSEASAPGVQIVSASGRYSEEVASHIIGYIDGSGNGVTGIEQIFDSILKEYSDTIEAFFPVDANGYKLRGLSAKVSASGKGSAGGVVTALDSEIQGIAQEASDKYLGNGGCVVVMDPYSGDILACVSSPDYSQTNVAAFLNSKNNPFVNRAFSSYNLGSVFKIVMTATALEEGVSPSFSYTCTGGITVGGGKIFHCPEASGHGTEDMAEAFANSCNTYFINLGQNLGGEAVLGMAKSLGLGMAATFAAGWGTDEGNLPSANDLKLPAELANLSIGEGKLLVTPIQVARIVSTVVNGGLEPTPRLIKGVVNERLDMVTSYDSVSPVRIFSKSTAAQIKEFMIKAVDEGTGTSAKPQYGGAGGKTGTAQTGVVVDGETIDQAWFAGFYPAESPKYVIVVLAENGTSGAASAGPVFKYVANALSEKCGYPAVSQ